MAEQLNYKIPGYGYTANPKHGTGGVQNLPTKIDTRELYWLLMGANAGKELGAPAWSYDPVTLLTKVLVEGRGDAGTNEYNYHNKQAGELAKKVENSITSPEFQNDARGAAMYPAAALDKTAVAKRLGIPIERAWNGTGKSAATGKTGQEHANKVVAATEAEVALDPRNAAILDYVIRGLNGQLTSAEHLAARIDELERRKLTTGGMAGNRLVSYIKESLPSVKKDPNSWKAADMLTATTVTDLAQGMYRNAAGLPPSQYRWATPPTATQRTEADIAASMPAIKAILQQLTGTGNAP